MKTPPLYLIQSFLAFTQAKNMSDAASALRMSQPALTAHMKTFEDYFPQDVFSLQGRKKILTPFGEQLKETLVGRFSNLEKDLKDLNDRFEKPEKISVRIAGRGEILNYLAPQINFRGNLIFVDTGGAQASEGVVDRQYEIAISNHTQKAGNLHAKKLFSDHSAVIIPKDWLGDKKSLSAALPLLLEKPFLAYKNEERAIEALFKHYQLKSNQPPHRVLANWPSLITMVELGQGWTLAPDRYKAGSRTISIPIPSNVVQEAQFYALYRKESVALPWFKALLEEIHKACR